MTKVLLTGGAGYIGSILTNRLLDNGYEVDVLDSLVFGGQSLIPHLYNPDFRLIHGSIRSVSKEVVKQYDVIIHTAAIVFTQGEYMAKQINEVNYEYTKNIVDLCKKYKKPFIFNSTCSNYGICKYATEESPVNPTNAYARSKINAEEYITKNYPSAVILRLSTVFGLSPRMRFDTTVNEFVLNAWAMKHLLVYNYDAWRPYIHIDDTANVYLFFLENPKLKGIFNIGDNKLNCTKRMVCHELKKLYPMLEIELVKEMNEPRDYKVSFDKLNNIGFKTRRTLSDGINEIKMAVERNFFIEPNSYMFNNFKVYQKYYK